MIPFVVDITNLRQVDAKLARLDSEIQVLRPLWERFGKEFYAEEAALFEREPWVPLSPTYAEQKRETFGDKPILRATDALFRSLTQQGATGNVHRVDDMQAEFGTSDFKAILHQFGTSRMPARPPLAEPDIDRYETIAGEYAIEMLRRAGFN